MHIKRRFLGHEHGSATVEAVVAFTGFLLVIFTILNVVNYCRVQMLISNAVDTAAKELSQYAYFYKMSGLQKFDKSVADNAEIGSNNLNQVIGTVDSLYKGLGTTVDNSVQNLTNVKNAVEGKGDLADSVKNTLQTLDTDVTNVNKSINSVMSAFEGVGNDPILYMKSIIAVAGNESLDLIKSHVIAAPLARLFFIKHFGNSAEEASEKLKKLGVVDGLDGMNFKMSTVFSSKEPDNIHLVVYYKLRLAQFFKDMELDVPICKEAVTRAWLGGDDVLVKVKPEVVSTPTEEPKNENGGENAQDGETETDEPTRQAEPVDTEGSFWHLTENDGRGYDEKSAAFRELMIQQTSLDKDTTAINHYYGRDAGNVAYSMMFCKDADDANYVATMVSLGLDYISDNEDTYMESNGEKGYEPGSTERYCMVVYVPENISDDELQAIQTKIGKDMDIYVQSYEMQTEKTVPVEVQYRKAGGNYDYNSGGGT